MLAAKYDTCETAEGTLAEIQMIAFNEGYVKSFHVSADDLGRDEFRRAINGANSDMERLARTKAQEIIAAMPGLGDLDVTSLTGCQSAIASQASFLACAGTVRICRRP